MNVSFEYSKTLAMEGSILLLLGLIPYVGWVLGIIGVILLLRAMKEFSNYYQDEEIYKRSLTGVKYYVVALIAVGVSIVVFVLGLAITTGFAFTDNFVPTMGFGASLATFIGGLVVAFVFYLLATSHLRKAFTNLAEKSGEASFATAGTLLWWGAIFTILFVGLLVILIGWIFAIVGFFTMKSRQFQQYNPQQNGNGYQPPNTQSTI